LTYFGFFGIFNLRSLFQNLVSFGKGFRKTVQKAGFSAKSKVAFPKTEVLEKPLIYQIFARNKNTLRADVHSRIRLRSEKWLRQVKTAVLQARRKSFCVPAEAKKMKALFESGKIKNIAECEKCKRLERRPSDFN